MFLIVSVYKICLRWGSDGQEKVHRLHIAVLNSGKKSCTICSTCTCYFLKMICSDMLYPLQKLAQSLRLSTPKYIFWEQNWCWYSSDYCDKTTYCNQNNVAEYEALLHDLRIAKDLRITQIQCFGDFDLVAQLVSGKRDANDPHMVTYKSMVDFAKCFACYEVNRIPRAEKWRGWSTA
jgi:hypothetical protein